MSKVANAHVINVEAIPSAVLRRLIKEVRLEQCPRNTTQMYNRIHNRHNRGR